MTPIHLHPDNPRYFLFRGKPTILITSAEHYGAVLNADFQFKPYLDTLKAHGFNLTRIFTGAYMEDPQSFGITRNTLAPAPGRLLCPWARSDTPGYANGGNKFDLNRWDDAYFRRLKEFVREAGKRGIVVEVTLFCPYYEDSMWNLSPLHIRNNVNGIGNMPRTEVNTLKHRAILTVQETMVRKIVTELKEFDNVYYEICNEPYFGGVTREWQHRIADVIVETQKDFPAPFMIAQNIANGSAKIENPHPAVSLFNFHYANPPDAVAVNASLNRAIGFDETGFKGIADTPYRTDGWEFILAGGAVYNHLDYSFTVGHEDGSFRLPEKQPGGGGPSLRHQLQTLREFIARFNFLKMRPANEIIRGGVPEGATARALMEEGKAVALYLKGGTQATLRLQLPAGSWSAQWVHPRTGETVKPRAYRHPGGELTLQTPPYSEDIALRLTRKP